MIQSIILFCGVLSIFLLSTKTYAIFGYIVIILSQPFWMYESYNKKQWGIFVLSIAYVLSALNGLINLGVGAWK